MRKFGNYWISEDAPKEGDKVICIVKNNFNFGQIETVTKLQADLGVVDRQSWKLIVDDKNAITVDGLLEFKQIQEVVYASHFGGGKNKKLVLTLSGGYKVYNDNEVVLETMTPLEAVKKYNLI